MAQPRYSTMARIAAVLNAPVEVLFHNDREGATNAPAGKASTHDALHPV